MPTNPMNPDKEIKGVPMIHSRLNGEFEIYVPKHRADRPEWYTKDGWERKRLNSMWQHLGVGDTMFYVGSEEADMCGLLASWGVELVLFEPNDKVWPNAKAIWDANNFKPPLATFSGFASDKTSKKVPLILRGFPESSEGEIIGNHGFKELIDAGDIPQVKIDDIVDQHGIIPTALTFDVEGSEFMVLRGAEQTLRKYKPKIWASLHPEFLFRMYGEYMGDLRKWIKDIGYKETILDYQHELHTYYEPI